MNVRIEFFSDSIIEAIGAGVYEICVIKNGEPPQSLYIGESVFLLVRCASHLFALKRDPSYFGFTNETINDCETKLVFRLITLESDTPQRKKIEKMEIQNRNPMLQSGISDRMKDVESRIEALTHYLKK